MGKPLNPKTKSRKRKVPTSFFDCPSLADVVGFPNETVDHSKEVVTTPVASDVSKELFLSRFEKEIVKPFQPRKTSGSGGFLMVDGKLVPAKQKASLSTDQEDTIWKQRIRLGANQCLRVLEGAALPLGCRVKPSMIVLARDVYPPTMLAHVPVLAKELQIPLLLLPGKASNEVGKALGIRKTSILLFLPSTETDNPNMAVNSFLDYVISLIPNKL